MTRIQMMIVVVMVVGLGACGVRVTPEWAARLDVKAANTRAYANSVANDSTIPTGVRGWIKDQAVQDSNIAAWANERPATTQP